MVCVIAVMRPCMQEAHEEETLFLLTHAPSHVYANSRKYQECKGMTMRIMTLVVAVACLTSVHAGKMRTYIDSDMDPLVDPVDNPLLSSENARAMLKRALCGASEEVRQQAWKSFAAKDKAYEGQLPNSVVEALAMFYAGTVSR
jgi:hypothetical protein